jgi:hypothetical protein
MDVICDPNTFKLSPFTFILTKGFKDSLRPNLQLSEFLIPVLAFGNSCSSLLFIFLILFVL